MKVKVAITGLSILTIVLVLLAVIWKTELETTKTELETTKAELETTKAELLLLKDNFNKEVERLKEIEQEKGSYFLMKLLQHITSEKYNGDMIVICKIQDSSQYLVDLIRQGLKKQGYNSSTIASDQRYRYGLSIHKDKLELKYHGRPITTINFPSD